MIGIAKLMMRQPASGAIGFWQDFTSSSSWVMDHNLSSLYPLAQCFNTMRSLFNPDSLTITTKDRIAVALVTPQVGSMIMFKGDATTSFVSQTTVNFTHNLGSTSVLVQVFDESKTEIIPDSVQVIDANNLTVTFATSQSGQINVRKGSYSQSFTSLVSWPVWHDKNTTKVMCVCYDSSGYMIKPASQVVTNKVRVDVTFSSAVSGTAVVGVLDPGTFVLRDGYPLIKATGFTSNMSAACFDTSNSTLWSWGGNSTGQLGDNTTTNRSSPVSVVGGHSFVSVSSSEQTTLALRSDGTIWSYGGNATYGQLGDGTTVPKSSPVSVLGGRSFVKLTAGNTVSFGLMIDGSCWAWGSGLSGRLGDNTTTSKSSPVSVVGGHSFTQIVTTSDTALALRGDGTLWSWGIGAQGYLGDGTNVPKSSPVSVLGGRSFMSIFGGPTPCAIESSGQVWTWGQNSSGELGDGTTTVKSSPVSVIGDHSFVQAASGVNRCIALKADGSAWVWGTNSSGVLGDGTTTNRSSPVSVVGGHSFVQVTAVQSMFMALKTDGTVWTWGTQNVGQFGDGATASGTRSSPNTVVKIFA